MLQCCDDHFPSSLSPTKVLSLIKAVFLLGKTIICLLAGCVCVWCVVVSILKTWIQWPRLGKREMVSDNQLLPHYGALQKTGLHNEGVTGGK
jgi:hypothetical protein